MIVPLIITGHTSHEDKETIVDGHGLTIDVIRNVDLCKEHNPNTNFYTIYSVDESIKSQKYFDYFDKVIYSDNIRHPYVGEKVKVETALGFIKGMKWECFIKSTSRAILHNIESFLNMSNQYDYIGSHHETAVQFSTAVFIGNKRLSELWVDCPPSIDIANIINTESEWLGLYGRLLLENLIWDTCKRYGARTFIAPRPTYYSNYEIGTRP